MRHFPKDSLLIWLPHFLLQYVNITRSFESVWDTPLGSLVGMANDADLI